MTQWVKDPASLLPLRSLLWCGLVQSLARKLPHAWAWQKKTKQNKKTLLPKNASHHPSTPGCHKPSIYQKHTICEAQSSKAQKNQGHLYLHPGNGQTLQIRASPLCPPRAGCQTHTPQGQPYLKRVLLRKDTLCYQKTGVEADQAEIM